MKAIGLFLLMLVSGVASAASEVKVATKVEPARKVAVFPDRNSLVSIEKGENGGATLEIEAFTSWCGFVMLNARVGSVAAAHQLMDDLIAQTQGIEGEVKDINSLIFWFENGELHCRVERVQSFLFTFDRTSLEGLSAPTVRREGTGMACEVMLGQF